MGKASSLGILAVMILAAAMAFQPALGSPATPAMIAEVLAALDRGDAQHAQILADAALREQGVSAIERGTMLLYRGLAWELLGAHDAAMGDFTQALDTRDLPTDAREQALLQRGFLRDSLGLLDQACRDYSAVIALKGDSLATALNNRANIYRRQNRLKDARRDYLAALSAGGGKPQYSYFGLGQIAETAHDTIAARGFYARAVNADPDYAAASERLAALEGTPDGASLARGDKIVLRPPTSQGTGTTAPTRSGDTVVPDAPARQAHAFTVALHPRQMGRAAVPRLAPVGMVALRPALDQPPDKPPGRPGTEVQLGAWRSAAEADAGWNKARGQAGDVLGGLRPHVLTVDLPGKGRYFRLRVSTGPDQSASAVCTSLTGRGIDCLPVRD